MESRTSSYFEVKVCYIKTDDNGRSKKVTELYAIDAMSFTEAETRITTELDPTMSFTIKAITRAAYHEVITDDDINAIGKYYKVKVAYITIDGDGKENRSIATYLVQSESLDAVKRILDVYFANSMTDWEKVSVVETKVLGVFFHKPCQY